MKCYRCGYYWAPKVLNPRQCPLCHADQPPWREIPRKYVRSADLPVRLPT